VIYKVKVTVVQQIRFDTLSISSHVPYVIVESYWNKYCWLRISYYGSKILNAVGNL